MAATKRPQNKCKSCGNTWHPRGKNISSKCPNCGSNHVSVVWPWGGIAALLVFGVGIFSGVDKPKEPSLTEPALASNIQPSEALEVIAPARPALAPTTAEHSMAVEAQRGDDTSLRAKNAASKASAQPDLQSNALSTPSSICANEGNLFSRNNCEWRECTKPEFTDMAECTHKKKKDDVVGG